MKSIRPTKKRKPAAKAAKPAGPNLSELSLKQLLDLEKRVQKSIADAQQKEKTEIFAKMRELANDAGLSMDDFVGGKGKGKGRGKLKSPSVAKYRNPDNAEETWTGRGRKPNWLVAKLKKGATMEEFAI